MARYLVERKRVQTIERTITSQTEIEVEEDALDSEIVTAAKRRRVKWEEVDSWDDVDSTDDSYIVVTRLDTQPEPVKGEPQDFGLEQEALFA